MVSIHSNLCDAPLLCLGTHNCASAFRLFPKVKRVAFLNAHPSCEREAVYTPSAVMCWPTYKQSARWPAKLGLCPERGVPSRCTWKAQMVSLLNHNMCSLTSSLATLWSMILSLPAEDLRMVETSLCTKYSVLSTTCEVRKRKSRLADLFDIQLDIQ